MTTPEEVKAVLAATRPNAWNVHLPGDAYTLTPLGTGEPSRLTREVIEALDKVRSKQKDGTVEEVIGVPAMGKFWGQDLEIYNRTGDTLRVTVQRSRPAPPLPDLQVGDRFTASDKEWVVLKIHSEADRTVITCRQVDMQNPWTSDYLDQLIKYATDFKRPVWEPVPTK